MWLKELADHSVSEFGIIKRMSVWVPFPIFSIQLADYRWSLFRIVLVRHQYNLLYRKLPISISQYRGEIPMSILNWLNYQIIENPVLKILSLFSKFYMIISTKTLSRNTKLISKYRTADIEKSSYPKSSYRNIDNKNIDPQNHIELKSLMFLIEPALVENSCAKSCLLSAQQRKTLVIFQIV